jgi:probable F420-dependent oxidoreductase
MELGAVLPHNEIGTDPAEIRLYLQGLEEIGATHLLAYDHVLGADRAQHASFSGPYDKDVAFHEPLTFFAFAAGITQSLQFATTVMVLPQRQAALVAKQAAEVAILSGNRLRLGVGTGWNSIEYEALGVPFEGRGKRQVEQIEIMRRLWSEPAITFAGTSHTITGAGILPRPTRPIPIWFGGSSPAVLERCARLGDGWMPLGGPGAKSEAAIEAIRSYRLSAGESMEDFGIQAQAQYAGGDPQRWSRHADEWRRLGATHLAVATHNAEPTDAAGHVDRVRRYFEAVGAFSI